MDQLFRSFARRTLPPTVGYRIRTPSRARPIRMRLDHPALQAARRAYRLGFGRGPVLLRSGGTIPVVNLLREVLAVPTVLMGFTLPDNRMHGPNERFRLSQLFRGIATCAHFLDGLADLPGT